MLVQEVLSRNLRDRRAVARYAGLTGGPDESGSKRREKGLAKSGSARVRRGTDCPSLPDERSIAQAMSLVRNGEPEDARLEEAA